MVDGLKSVIIVGDYSVTADEIQRAAAAYELCRTNGMDARYVLAEDEKGKHRLLCAAIVAGVTVYCASTLRCPAERGELRGWRLIMVSPWNPLPDDRRRWRQVLSLKVSHR